MPSSGPKYVLTWTCRCGAHISSAHLVAGCPSVDSSRTHHRHLTSTCDQVPGLPLAVKGAGGLASSGMPGKAGELTPPGQTLNQCGRGLVDKSPIFLAPCWRNWKLSSAQSLRRSRPGLGLSCHGNPSSSLALLAFLPCGRLLSGPQRCPRPHPWNV